MSLKNSPRRSINNNSILGNEYTIGSNGIPQTSKNLAPIKPNVAATNTLRHQKAVGSWMNEAKPINESKLSGTGGDSEYGNKMGNPVLRGKAFGSRNRSV